MLWNCGVLVWTASYTPVCLTCCSLCTASHNRQAIMQPSPSARGDHTPPHNQTHTPQPTPRTPRLFLSPLPLPHLQGAMDGFDLPALSSSIDLFNIMTCG